MDGSMDIQKPGQTDRCIDVRTDRRVDSWMDGQTNGQTDRWTDIWIDTDKRWVDG